MKLKQIARACVLAAAAMAAGGCVSYPRQALSGNEELAALSRVDLLTAKIEPAAAFSPRGGDVFDLSDGLSEAEVVAVGLTLSPQLQAKRAQAGEAQALLVTAGLWPNPEVGIGVRPGIGANGVEVDAEMLFELLRVRERATQMDIAQAHIEQAKAEIAAEEYRVAGEIRSAWLVVLVAEQSVGLFKEESGLRLRALDLARQRRTLGEGTVLEVSLAELELADVGREARRAQATLDAARRKLHEQMGVPPAVALKLSESGKPLGVTVYEALGDEAIGQQLLARRFDVKAVEQGYRAAEEELQLALLKQYPRLKVGPSFSQDGEGADFLGLGVSLEVPLFDRNQGEIAGAVSRRDRLRAEYRALLFKLNAAAQEARAEMDSAREEIAAQEKELLPQLEKTQTLFESAFRARELSILEWMTIQERALRARRGYLESLARYREAVIQLETATGQMLVPATTQGATTQKSGA